MNPLMIPLVVLAVCAAVAFVIMAAMAVHPILGLVVLGVVIWRCVTIGPIRWQ